MKATTMNLTLSRLSQFYKSIAPYLNYDDFICQGQTSCNACNCGHYLPNFIEPEWQLELLYTVHSLIKYCRTTKDLNQLLQQVPQEQYPLAAHNLRTAAIAISIGLELNLDKTTLKAVGLGGLLHDLGKLEIPSAVIDKPGHLTTEEYNIVKTHSQRGFHMLKKESWLPKESLYAILNHHERLDGSGYPNGLKAKALSVCDRIVAVADVFDAMTSKRVYKKSLTWQDALFELSKLSPQQFDPHVVEALEQIAKYKPAVSLKPSFQPVEYERRTYAAIYG